MSQGLNHLQESRDMYFIFNVRFWIVDVCGNLKVVLKVQKMAYKMLQNVPQHGTLF